MICTLTPLIILLCTWALATSAQTLPSYDVYRVASPITIDGKLKERAWGMAPLADDFHFNWWKAGEKEQTIVRMLWDDQNLYVSYYCFDKQIYAKVTEPQGPVSTDDAIEFYVSPNPNKLDYDGLEINALGTLLGFRVRNGKVQLRWQPEGIRCRTSRYYDHWILELAIPWKNFSDEAAHTPPHNGDRWRVNLNRIDRLGKGTNFQYQYSTWSPVNTPSPRFSVPESFGWVKFVNRKPPKHLAEYRLGR